MTPDSTPRTEFVLVDDGDDEPTEFVIVDDAPSSTDLVPVDDRGAGCLDLAIYRRGR